MREVVERTRKDGGDGEDFCDVRTACQRYNPIRPDEVIINGGLLMPIKWRKAWSHRPRLTFGPARLITLPRVQRAFSDAASIASPINNSGELTVLVDDVKITLPKYPFPTFDPFVIYEQGTRSAVAAPTTLMAAKAERNLERSGDLLR
jgi:hypothetical protein